MSCIFCKHPINTESIEHILPESLGGKEWACLPKGIVCASCNQYFGSKVEPLALGSFPFLPFRLLLGIPTKHGKSPKLDTHLGTFRAGHITGQIGIDPLNSDIEEAINTGKIRQIRILAEPTEPLAVCRLLLKMGLEVIANQSCQDVIDSRFDAARRFARAPSLRTDWWFLICTKHELLFEKFKQGCTADEWVSGVRLEIIDVEGAKMFHLKLLDLDLITPLEPHIYPPEMDTLPEPEFRLFYAKCC